MTLTTSSFFMFLFVAVLGFYLFKPLQKYILLVASIFFYFSISSINRVKLGLLILLIGAITYFGALLTARSKGAVRKLILFGSISSLVILLFLFKYLFNIVVSVASILHLASDFSFLKLGAVIGMSYYTMTAIGYLVDVYWENTEADKNVANVFLFLFFFPQLISGPITRYGQMKPQFVQVRSFDPDRLLHGMRRMIWGYFKKLVISERFAVAVNAVYGNYADYSLVGILGASLCYAVQIYTDFSGCMDIIMGAAQMFGIELPENFNAPFFSETLQEFWQRWHISLGKWFKDYLMYPLQKTAALQGLGKKLKKRFGKKAGKKVPLYLSMLVLWFLLGLWHGGTIQYFVASGAIPFVYLVVSDICQPLFKKLTVLLKVDTGCTSWKIFRMVRTSLFMCAIWTVICSGDIGHCALIVQHAFSNVIGFTSFDSAVAVMGLTARDLILMGAGLLIVFGADLCAYRGGSIFETMDRQNKAIRIAVVYLEVLAVFVYGMVGQSPFIYFQF